MAPNILALVSSPGIYLLNYRLHIRACVYKTVNSSIYYSFPIYGAPHVCVCVCNSGREFSTTNNLVLPSTVPRFRHYSLVRIRNARNKIMSFRAMESWCKAVCPSSGHSIMKYLLYADSIYWGHNFFSRIIKSTTDSEQRRKGVGQKKKRIWKISTLECE